MYPDVNSDFIFAYPGYNVRNTEIGAILGISQLPRLPNAIERRRENLHTFLTHLDTDKYRRNFCTEGNSSYALALVLLEPDDQLRAKVCRHFDSMGIEYRQGMSGGGNQLRQPYLRRMFGKSYHAQFPEAEFITDYGWYIGNYPSLETARIKQLCDQLNRL